MSDDGRAVTWAADLGLIIVWGLLVALVVLSTAAEQSLLSTSRIFLAGSYLLFAPGYALLAVLFPSHSQLSLLERAVFSVGASLALVALLGIPLEVTPWGVTTQTVLIEQLLVSTVLVVLAGWRRLRRGVTTTPLDEFVSVLRDVWSTRSAVGGGSPVVQAAIVLAVVLLLGATAYTVTTPLPSEQYTELSVAGPDGTIQGIPSNASVGESIALTIRTANHEFSEKTYGLQVQARDSGDGETRVVWTRTFRSSHNESRELTRSFAMPDTAGQIELQILLFEGEPPGEVVSPDTAFRSVDIKISVDDE